ncbi:hypothetical protein [Tateyamaria sp.]|uniref:hypothetical protein n=1 Tax=Tateyamaria sp. TaxID=1929288 RepID=UPI003B22057F
MFPFFFAPRFEYPLSGDVTQAIAPSFGDIEGVPEVEHEVITSVASYGKQLGKLTEAMLAVAEKVGLEGPEIDDLREISSGVKEAKGRALEAVRARAEKAAERVAVLEKGDTR